MDKIPSNSNLIFAWSAYF